MTKSASERRDILRRFMSERGLKPAEWARRAKVSANSIYNFLNDGSEGLADITYKKLARVEGVPAWKISGDEPEPLGPTTVWVAGAVEAGAFREALEWESSAWYSVDVPVAPRFQGRARALEVRGPSMNVEYPEGSVVIWVEVLAFRAPEDGDHVIAYAYSDDDGAVEATIKEYRVQNGGVWLWPRSHDPRFQAPINPREPEPHITRIEVEGIVIGGYRPRIK